MNKLAYIAGLAISSVAMAGSYTEGADVGGSKGSAAIVSAWANGETISGTVSSSSDLDYYRVSSASAPAGIYRHRVNLAGGSGGRYSTRGTGVSSASDVNFNSDRISGEYLTWYDFGNAAEIYLRAGRSGSGSNGYIMTHAVNAVTPTPAGSLGLGVHTFASVLVGDSEIYLYDGAFNLIGQNDSQVAGDVRAKMTYNFTTAGTFYIAIGSGNSSTHVGTNTTPGYSNDVNNPFYDSNVGSGARTVILDFAGLVSRPENLSRTASEFGLSIDSGAGINHSANVGGQELAWFSITVVPAPSSLALVGLAGVAAARRRRA
ncbi:MAG: hypothetical protein GIKADHBN_00254 [Phycisphaerales bacterium]|nr:hypothetical protein [Phycisphaerales bacterium]